MTAPMLNYSAGSVVQPVATVSITISLPGNSAHVRLDAWVDSQAFLGCDAPFFFIPAMTDRCTPPSILLGVGL
jgi:hypothetical protein